MFPCYYQTFEGSYSGCKHCVQLKLLDISSSERSKFEVVVKFLSGHDILGCYPYSMGRVCVMPASPGAFDHQSRMSEPSIVIVATPLMSI